MSITLALNDSGIDYIELRSIDINPLSPLGIDKDQIYFLEAFMLFCLLESSPAISSRGQFEIDNNDRLVAHEGRKPGLKLMHQGQSTSLKKCGEDLCKKIESCAQLLSRDHSNAVNDIARRINNPDLTPSAVTLIQMKDRSQGFFDYINSFSKKYRRDFLSNEVDQQHFNYLDKQAQFSCEKQAEIERSDNVSFDQFLVDYFKRSPCDES